MVKNMKWELKGELLNFNDTPFKNKFTSHLQYPQPLVCDDFVRIFLSIRKKNENDVVSHAQYVDFSKDFSQVLGYSDHEILSLGGVGTFDEHGIFPLSPTRINGNTIYAYYTGLRKMKSVSADSYIGLSISKNNGKTFEKFGIGPILAHSLQEPFLVLDACVRKFDDVFYMFYLAGKEWLDTNETAERVYKIRMATSDNGIDWVKHNKDIISNVIDENECHAYPTVIKINDLYHMYFSYRNAFDFRDNPKNSYKIGYAYSKDLINWTRDDQAGGMQQNHSQWDSQMQAYPYIFNVDNGIYMLYNGNNFGATSFGLAKLAD